MSLRYRALRRPRVKVSLREGIQHNMSSNRGEVYLSAHFSPYNEVHLLPAGTRVGRTTLSTMGIRSAENPKKLCVSRQHALFIPTTSGITAHATGSNPLYVIASGEKKTIKTGDSVSLSVGDRVGLLHNWFVFSVERDVEERSLGKRKLDAKGDRYDKRSSQKKHNSRRGEVVVGKPVKHWDQGKRMWVKGMVIQMNVNEETKERMALVDIEGDHVWKPANELIVESTMMQIKETDIIRSMTDGPGGKSKRQRKSGQPSDRVTRSRGRVTYAEWMTSSSEAEDGDMTHMMEESEKDINKFADREPTHLAPDQVSDGVTAIFYSKACEKHFVPKWHYEKPERLDAIMKGLENLVKKYPTAVRIVEDFPPLTSEDLVLAHNHAYLDRVKQMVPDTDVPTHITQYTVDVDSKVEEDFDTFMSKSSWEAILMANGAVRKAIDMVHNREVRNTFCAIRPPGHHCGASGHTEGANSQGYCIVNNVVLGALYAKEKYNYERIAIVDFDVHHGNGTEELLSNKDGFLFVSIHAHDIYPHTGSDNIPRAPNVVNVALEVGDSSEEFHRAFDQKIMPALRSYSPDLLIISAGFDAHKKDPTDGLNLEEQDYFTMTEKLKQIAEEHCGGRIVSVLEGGYHLPSLKRSVREHLISLIKK
ncbi:hypothetical protein PROFUN_04118 [Planoprotostelium fungivorum]|uniref:histone deacetylase n=1 Tax=Planoprotostelium fungivorum TaxID=1890364 RepID=A0A2P6N209_9EUKA|nr:hypothetical protein PROFUN_14082 [Planoprotostelium fungivorum]PRP84127.1 hypothetical protein PROFUN_04118 [Planoprotostelium fungivorum]